MNQEITINQQPIDLSVQQCKAEPFDTLDYKRFPSPFEIQQTLAGLDAQEIVEMIQDENSSLTLNQIEDTLKSDNPDVRIAIIQNAELSDSQIERALNDDDFHVVDAMKKVLFEEKLTHQHAEPEELYSIYDLEEEYEY